jgi:hypothetical protein
VVHQCARHCANPKIQHTAAVKRIGRYLLGTKDKGLIMKPNHEGMECWVDAAHASEWNNKTASSDPSTARSKKENRDFIYRYLTIGKTDSHHHGPASEDLAGEIIHIMGLWKCVCHCTPPNLSSVNPYSNS